MNKPRRSLVERIAPALDYLLFAAAAASVFTGAPRAKAEPLPAFEQHFAPETNLEKLDVAAIGGARERLDVAAYVLTDVAVIDALAEAARRGVRVRVYRDGKPFEAGPTVDAAIERLASSPAEIRYKAPAGPFMHLKAYCVDGHTLRTGAANFSASGEKMQDNDAIFLRGANVCAAFDAHFSTMWGR